MTALAIMAHPDDEVFRCGGTLAMLSRSGVQVHLLTATRGQAGSLGNPPLCSRAELGKLREAELGCACKALEIPPPDLLDYEDGALSGVDPTQAAQGIAAFISKLNPAVIVTMPPHGLSGHADHIAVSRWVEKACVMYAADGGQPALYHLAVPESVANSLGLRQLHATPDRAINVSVDITPVWELKMAAIRCHHSQADESPILRAPLERQRLFLGIEHFTMTNCCPLGNPLTAMLDKPGVR